MIIAVKWCAKVNELMNVVSLIGISENNSELAKYAIIKNAVNIYEMARECGGVIIPPNSVQKANSPLSISFELIFKTKEDMGEFVQKLGEGT